MKSTNGSGVLFGAVVFAILAAVLVYAISPRNTTPKQTDTQPVIEESKPQVSVREIEPEKPKFDIIYLARDGSNTKIFRANQTGANPKLLYNDAKDSEKLKAVAGMRNDGSAIYLIVAPADKEFIGKLVEISTDGKATLKTIQESITYTAPPVVSPVGDKLALISFKNDEANIGFNITLSNKDSSDPKTLYSSQETISLLDFSSDGKKLAIVKTSPSGGSQIVVADIPANTTQGIYSSTGNILSLDIEQNGIVLVEAPSGVSNANKTEVIKLDADGKNVTKLTNNSLAETSIHFDPEEKQAAYVQINYDNGLAKPATTGDVVTILINEKTETVVGKAIGIIGWVQ